MAAPTQRANSVPSREEITVYFKVTKTLALRVNKTHTIRNIKELLSEKEGIPKDVQQLFFDGNEMEDGCKIADYDIVNNSTVNVSSLAVKLHVKVLSTQKTIVLDARYSDTIQQVKSAIEAIEGIPRKKFTLYHDGEQLEDMVTLASVNVHKDSNFQLVNCPRDVIWIMVKAPEREGKILKVKLLQTVGEVTRLAKSSMNLPPGNWRILDGKSRAWLEESKTLAYYEIKANAVLTMQDSKPELVPCPRDMLWISVEAPERDKIRLKVQLLQTVGDVKRLAEEIMNLPFGNWHIHDNRMKLEESKTLAYHEIKENAVLTMSTTYQIFVTTWSNETLVLEVSNLNTVGDVKRIISVRKSVPTDRIWLCYALNVLTDCRDLSSYNIYKDSTLIANIRL